MTYWTLGNTDIVIQKRPKLAGRAVAEDALGSYLIGNVAGLTRKAVDHSLIVNEMALAFDAVADLVLAVDAFVDLGFCVLVWSAFFTPS